HKPIDERAVANARRKGRINLRAAVRKRLEKYLAPAAPPRDGYQTPYQGNAIYYAQHSIACCCRKCLEYWHAIPQGRDLTSEEIEYCASLIGLYLQERLPDLRDEPEKVPPRRAPPPEQEARP